MSDRPLKSIARGWASRTVKTGRLAASVGRAAARKMVDTALDRVASEPGDDEGAASSAEALAERMDELKGLMLKFGQMASYLDGAMPESAQKVLRRLQAQARPLEWPEVEAVLRAELGGDVGALFDRFEPEPFAAASIGQVHRAEVGGRRVAVKVQYPEIASTLDIDLKNLRRIAFLGSIGTAIDSNALVTELRDRLREECDYRFEADWSERFARHFADDERIVIPDVLPDRSGERVLTTSFVDGKAFYAFAEEASQEERDRAAQILYGFAFRSIFGAAMFNGDPHPGNYLFLPDGRVAFLDFGCVRRYDVAFIEQWKRFARATLADDFAAWKDVFLQTGFVVDDKFDFQHQWQVMKYLYEPMQTPGFRYTHEYVRESYDLLLWKTPNQRRIAMPPEWLLTQRLQWGLNSILALLHAQGDWGGLFREALDLPITPVGPRPPEATPRA